MFTSHIDTAIVVITLSRPQMATLVRNHRNQRMILSCENHIPTKNQEERGNGNREPRGNKHTTEPSLFKMSRVYARKGRSNRPLTLQLKRLVRLNPTKLRQTDVRANIRAVRYTANDHFHGRLPVNTSHSKSRVVKNSHLQQAAVSAAESVG
jgi:hypothetical protein